MKRFFLRLFLRSADDLIGFLDDIEARLRKLADEGYAEASRLNDEAYKARDNADKAARVADRVKG